MYKLEFSKDAQGEKRYTLCFEACVSQKEPPAVSDWDTVIDLIRKLKSIGILREKVGGKVDLYDLDKEGACVIFLEKAEYKKLMAFVKAPVWPAYVLDEIKPMVKWLESLKHEPGSLADGAKGSVKKAGEAQVAGSIQPSEQSGAEAASPSRD